MPTNIKQSIIFKELTMFCAKPIIKNKFWIIEDSGKKIAALQVSDDNQYILSISDKTFFFENKEELTKNIELDFHDFNQDVKVTVSNTEINECYGFATSYKPHNEMYDVKKKLPLFTKSDKSKCLFCAGHYIIKFNTHWVKSFCPKLLTIERYPYKGPFKTEAIATNIMVLSNAKSN